MEKRRYTRRSLPEKFNKHFEAVTETGCWLWTGAIDPAGYGRFFPSASKSVLAHRQSYILHVGIIPDGICVLHRCDTPACVNPEHLFLGTHQDNIADMDKKGRRKPISVGPSGIRGVNWISSKTYLSGGFWRTYTEQTPERKRVQIYSGPDFFEACCRRKSWEAKQGLVA